MDNPGWSPRSLDEARERIDAIDGTLLDLLHERARVVEHVGRLKREGGGVGAATAFRPAREIAMLRSLHARTRDPLVFATVFAVWREIVSGFTAAQVPLSVTTRKASVFEASVIWCATRRSTPPASHSSSRRATISLADPSQKSCPSVFSCQAMPWRSTRSRKSYCV